MQKPSNESIPFKLRLHHGNSEQQTQIAKIPGRKEGISSNYISTCTRYGLTPPCNSWGPLTPPHTLCLFLLHRSVSRMFLQLTHLCYKCELEHVFSRNSQNTTSVNKIVIFTFHRGKLKAVYCTSYVT